MNENHLFYKNQKQKGSKSFIEEGKSLGDKKKDVRLKNVVKFHIILKVKSFQISFSLS